YTHRRRTTIASSASSYCRTRPCAPRRIRQRRSVPLSTARTSAQPLSAGGTAPRSSGQPSRFDTRVSSTELFNDWYSRNRARTQALFDLITDEAYYSRPIALRHPIVFYGGHLPAFSFNTLVKRALGGASIDPTLEGLFARGIDPSDDEAGGTSGHHW